MHKHARLIHIIENSFPCSYQSTIIFVLKNLFEFSEDSLFFVQKINLSLVELISGFKIHNYKNN